MSLSEVRVICLDTLLYIDGIFTVDCNSFHYLSGQRVSFPQTASLSKLITIVFESNANVSRNFFTLCATKCEYYFGYLILCYLRITSKIVLLRVIIM